MQRPLAKSNFKPTNQCTNWSFTINNPTESDIQALSNPVCLAMVYQPELGESGTPHIQGGFITKRIRLSSVSKLLPRAHIEPARSMLHTFMYSTKNDSTKQGPAVIRGQWPISIQKFITDHGGLEKLSVDGHNNHTGSGGEREGNKDGVSKPHACVCGCYSECKTILPYPRQRELGAPPPTAWCESCTTQYKDQQVRGESKRIERTKKKEEHNREWDRFEGKTQEAREKKDEVRIPFEYAVVNGKSGMRWKNGSFTPCTDEEFNARLEFEILKLQEDA